MQRCMAEKGWMMAIDEEGGLAIDVPVEQGEALEQADRECQEKFGYDQPPPPMTQEEAEVYYEKLLATGECVRDMGFTTPELPSRQSTIESLTQPGRLPNWNPHENLIEEISSYDELIKVTEEECPFPSY